jgi:hypothetical protein
MIYVSSSIHVATIVEVGDEEKLATYFRTFCFPQSSATIRDPAFWFTISMAVLERGSGLI